MSSVTYEAIAFLQNGSDFDLGLAAQGLADWLPNWRVIHRGKVISVQSPGCEFTLHLMDEPFVAEESRDMPAYFATCPRAADIEQCKRRVELSCANRDPEMEHFNDFVFVCQALEEFRGIILFDPRSGELI